MERFKKILKKLFLLPPLPTLLISLPSLIFVFVLMAAGITDGIAYLAYFLSAYGLVILVMGIPAIADSGRRFASKLSKEHPIFKKIRSHPAGDRYLTDSGFRENLSLWVSLFINLVYIVIKLSAGIYFRSLWLISMACYYALLAAMRYVILRRPYNSKVGEYRSCRLCGYILLFMNQALAVIVSFIVKQNYGYEYPGLLVYIMAVYSFYYVIAAVVNLIRFRKKSSPAMLIAKAISVVAAAVAMLSLETAMLAQFGRDDTHFRQIMTASTGGAVCTMVLCLAIVIIVKSSKNIKRIKHEQQNI